MSGPQHASAIQGGHINSDAEARVSYIEFLTTNESDSTSCTVSEEDLSPELYNYLSKDMETKLPSYINQKKLL